VAPDCGWTLFKDVGLDPVDERVVVNGTRVSRSSAKGLEVCLAGASQVRVIDGGERDQFDRVNLNLPSFDAITAPGLHLWSPPQADRDRDLTGQHVRAQLLAELHESKLAATTSEGCRVPLGVLAELEVRSFGRPPRGNTLIQWRTGSRIPGSPPALALPTYAQSSPALPRMVTVWRCAVRGAETLLLSDNETSVVGSRRLLPSPGCPLRRIRLQCLKTSVQRNHVVAQLMNPSCEISQDFRCRIRMTLAVSFQFLL